MPQIIDGAEAFEVEVAFVVLGGMAGEAISGERCAGIAGEFGVECRERRGLRARAGKVARMRKVIIALPAREKPMVPLMSAVS